MSKTTFPSSDVNRRQFLKGVGGAVLAPTLVPSSVFGENAPSNRINVAVIGCGNQGRADIPGMLRQPDVQVVAVCDVNRGSDGYARPEHFLGREPARKTVNDYYAAQKNPIRSIQRLRRLQRHERGARPERCRCGDGGPAGSLACLGNRDGL